MAKVSWKKVLTHGLGAIKSGSVSSIKHPSSPIVFGKNQQSDTIYAPRYNRQEPKGGQTDQRGRYCECVQGYLQITEEEKRQLYKLSWDYCHAHSIVPLFTAFQMYMHLCLQKDLPTIEVAKIEWDFGSFWCGITEYLDIPETLTEGIYVLKCEGKYTCEPGDPDPPTCGNYAGEYGGWIHAWCNSARKELGELVGVHMRLNGVRKPIVEYTRGSSEIYIFPPIESLGFECWIFFGCEHTGICTYTLSQVIV